MRKPKAYLVIIRGSQPKQIDEDELGKVIACFTRKTGTVVRQGFINGVDVVDIREDKERIERFLRRIDEVTRHNNHDAQYDGGKDQIKIPESLPKLKDIFDGVNYKKYLDMGQGENLQKISAQSGGDNNSEML